KYSLVTTRSMGRGGSSRLYFTNHLTCASATAGIAAAAMHASARQRPRVPRRHVVPRCIAEAPTRDEFRFTDLPPKGFVLVAGIDPARPGALDPELRRPACANAPRGDIVYDNRYSRVKTSRERTE